MAFKKGDPNINRKGRPKKAESLTEQLRDYMKGKITVKEGDKQRTDEVHTLFIERVVRQALNGDTVCMKYIWDRLEGTPTQITSEKKLEYTLEDIKNLGNEELIELFKKFESAQ